MAMKYGKLPATHDRRDLLMVEFVDHKMELKEAPVGFGVERDLGKWGMLGNGPDPDNPPSIPEGCGDCAWAGPAHEHMLTTRANPDFPDATFTTMDVLDAYASCTGFDPKTGVGDQGTNMRDGLNFRRNTGIKDSAGTMHKVGGYCALEPGNFEQFLQALEIFDVVGIGIEVPESCEPQFAAGKPWSVVPGSQIEGGHYIPGFCRPGLTMGGVVTWGRKQLFTKSFYAKYNDEAYGIFVPETLDKGKSPEGFSLDDFKTALAEL